MLYASFYAVLNYEHLCVGTLGGKPKPLKIPSTQFQPRHDHIQIDNLTIAVKGIVPVQVNMAPRCRRNLLEQGEGFLVPAGFTLGQQPRKDRRVVVGV